MIPPIKKINYTHIGSIKRALGEVCELFEFGKKKYPDKDWSDIKDSDELWKFIEARLGSLSRHTVATLNDVSSKDQESNAHNLAAVAWNALVVLELLYMDEDIIDVEIDEVLERGNPPNIHIYGRHMMPPNTGEINE